MKRSLGVVCVMLMSLSMTAEGGNLVVTSSLQGEDVHADPEKVVSELYRLVSFEAGTMPDLDKVKALFIEEAVIVLRLGPKTMRTFDRQSFVDYFIYDIKRANLLDTGFKETILNSQMQVIKDIAHCYCLYAVIVPGRNDDKPVNRGVDSFHLINRDGRWQIASIINEGFRMTEPVPEFLNKKDVAIQR